MCQLVHQRGEPREHLRRDELREKRTHKCLLTRDAPNVPRTVPITHILNRMSTVHML